MAALPNQPQETERRYPFEVARGIAVDLKELLAPRCERIEIGGSLRRGKPEVKDIEMVIMSDDYEQITDELIASGILEKRLVNTAGGKLSPRWGEKTRFARHVESGIAIDLFRADRDNWGWQYMLRTGSGEANQVIVTRVKWGNAPFRFEGGYVWAGHDKLRIDSEADMYALLGIHPVEPKRRTPETYTALLKSPNHRWGDPAPFIVPTVQMGMFESSRFESALSGISGETERPDRKHADLRIAGEYQYDEYVRNEVMPNRFNPEWHLQHADQLEAAGHRFSAWCYRERARALLNEAHTMAGGA